MTLARNEHWFDRLAAPHTRRQGLKAAVVSTLLATPFGRVALASEPRQSGPPACWKGCTWYANEVHKDTLAGCKETAQYAATWSVTTLMFAGAGPALLQSARLLADYLACSEGSTLGLKRNWYACFQDESCSGFDPFAPGGPCAGCHAANGCACCPDPRQEKGYTACTLTSGGTASTNFCGCGSGDNPCRYGC